MKWMKSDIRWVESEVNCMKYIIRWIDGETVELSAR